LKFSLYGAAGGEVTGSGLLVETGQSAVLVDFGLYQGSRESEEFNRLPENLPLDHLSAVALTHAHLDHCGRLPLLAKEGYRRAIYATKATLELAGLVLRDAARIARTDLAKGGKERGSPAESLFGLDHVNRVERLGQPVPYKKAVSIAPGVTLRLSDAGHLLGSASVELMVEENGRKQVAVISGDLGQRGAPLHTDPVPFKHADIVFMECTYGGHDHRPLAETVVEAREIIKRTIAAGGKILVPAFALGRTQQILYLLAGAFQRKTLPRFPVYVDSPMAIEATQIYGRHVDLFDEEALAMYKSGELRKNLGTMQVTVSAADSRVLAARDGPCMILAGSGMCNAGRIRLHLKESLPHWENAVLIAGYQAEGTLGRQLVDGARTVIIDGEEVPVRASVHTLGGLSAHAGQSDLLQWLGSMAASRPRVILTHGEDPARAAMAGLIERRFGLKPELPDLGAVIAHP
jgi:metallo-beta-lactamase family protein